MHCSNAARLLTSFALVMALCAATRSNRQCAAAPTLLQLSRQCAAAPTPVNQSDATVTPETPSASMLGFLYQAIVRLFGYAEWPACAHRAWGLCGELRLFGRIWRTAECDWVGSISRGRCRTNCKVKFPRIDKTVCNSNVAHECSCDEREGCDFKKNCDKETKPVILTPDGKEPPLMWRKRCESGALHGDVCKQVVCEVQSYSPMHFQLYRDEWVPMATSPTRAKCDNGRLDEITCTDFSEELCAHLEASHQTEWVTLASDQENRPGLKEKDRLTLKCREKPTGDEVSSIKGAQYIQVPEISSGVHVLYVSKGGEGRYEKDSIYTMYITPTDTLTYNTVMKTIHRHARWMKEGDELKYTYRPRKTDDEEIAKTPRDLCCCQLRNTAVLDPYDPTPPYLQKLYETPYPGKSTWTTSCNKECQQQCAGEVNQCDAEQNCELDCSAPACEIDSVLEEVKGFGKFERSNLAVEGQCVRLASCDELQNDAVKRNSKKKWQRGP